VPFFFYCDMVVFNSFQFLFKSRKLMVVGCKQCPYPNFSFVVQKLNNSFCDAVSVVSTRSPSNFIEEDKASGACIVQDICKFHHFYHESTLPACKVIKGSYSRKNLVNNPYGSIGCRDKRARLSHDSYKGSLAHIGGLSCHIRARNQQKLVLFAVHFGIVRDKTA